MPADKSELPHLVETTVVWVLLDVSTIGLLEARNIQHQTAGSRHHLAGKGLLAGPKSLGSSNFPALVVAPVSAVKLDLRAICGTTIGNIPYHVGIGRVDVKHPVSTGIYESPPLVLTGHCSSSVGASCGRLVALLGRRSPG